MRSSVNLTGRLLRTEILVISFVLIMASSTAVPTRPVAPVKMRCILLLGGFAAGIGERREVLVHEVGILVRLAIRMREAGTP